MKDSKIDYLGIIDRLGAELVSLQPMRAKETGGDSPGKYMIVTVNGDTVRLDPPLLQAMHDSYAQEAGE